MIKLLIFALVALAVAGLAPLVVDAYRNRVHERPASLIAVSDWPISFKPGTIIGHRRDGRPIFAMGGGSAPTQAVAPGAYFDVPGLAGGATQWTEQDDTTTNQATVHASGQQVPIQGILPYRQTDIVTDWYLQLAVAQTYTVGTSAFTASAYAPYNLIGPVKQLIQNQYASVEVESGIDLYIFNLARPYDASEASTVVNVYSDVAGSQLGGTAGAGYLTAALAQVNQINAAQWSTATTAYMLILRLPASQWFDAYWDLAITGEPVNNPHPALVSPQYLAGTTRNITPQFTINPGNAAVTDGGPVNISAGTGTYVGSSVLRLRRRGIYAGQAAASPPVYAWQYRWHTQRFSASGVSRLDLNVPLDTGQILFIYQRLFDPSAAAGLGAPVNINTVTRFNLQYGSGLLRFDAQSFGTNTAAALVQRQWFAKHGNLLPAGVMGVDLALDERKNLTNARALNTLTTAGVLLHSEFTAALSATAYAVLGTESLVYVT